MVSDWFIATLTKTSRSASLGKQQSYESPGPMAERMYHLGCNNVCNNSNLETIICIHIYMNTFYIIDLSYIYIYIYIL